MMESIRVILTDKGRRPDAALLDRGSGQRGFGFKRRERELFTVGEDGADGLDGGDGEGEALQFADRRGDLLVGSDVLAGRGRPCTCERSGILRVGDRRSFFLFQSGVLCRRESCQKIVPCASGGRS
jgi:hypothetical protein